MAEPTKIEVLVKDPEYQKLSGPERIKVLSTVDPEFSTLNEQEQVDILGKLDAPGIKERGEKRRAGVVDEGGIRGGAEALARGGLSTITAGLSEAGGKMISGSEENDPNSVKFQNPYLYATGETLGAFLPAGRIVKGAKTSLQAAGTTLQKIAPIVKEGMRVGGIFGAGQGVSEEIMSDDPTVTGALKKAATGGLAGAATGGLIPAAAVGGVKGTQALAKLGKEGIEKIASTPVVDKVVDAVKRPFTRAAITKEAEKATKQYSDEVAEKISETVTTPEAKATVKKTVQEAHANGILPEHTSVIQDMTPDERAIADKMTDQAEKWKLTRKHDDDPFRVGGEEFMKRINDLDAITDDIGKKQGKAVAGIPEIKVRTAQRDALASMQSVPGFEGLVIDAKGMLDFSNTRFMSDLSKSKRAIIQKYFDASKKKNAKQLDLLRKEMFEDLGGKRKARVELNESQEKLMDAIRKGYADTIERVSPEYKALNQQYAESITPLREMMKFFKNVKDAPEDIRELQAGTLMRRLTSHAQSNAELRSVLGAMESVLAKNGKKYDTRIDKLQDYMNVLNLYYQLDKPTSIGGIIRSSTGNELPIGRLETVGAALKAVGKKAIGDTSITPAVQQQNLKNVIKAVQGKKGTVASPAPSVKAKGNATASPAPTSAKPVSTPVVQAGGKTTTVKPKGALAGIKRAAKRKKSNKE